MLRQLKMKRIIHGLLWRILLLLNIFVVTGTALGQQSSSFGHYYALVIGNQNYRHLTKLKTPLADATEVARVLKEKYGFEVELLLDATRDQMMDAKDRLRNKLNREQDNLLIYYAGHGYLDREGDVGYWQPIDAKKNNTSAWFRTSNITSLVKVIRAKHVMIVADSCYSGSLLTRDSGAKLASGMDRNEWLKRMQGRRSRTALTSGAEEPVSDAGGGEHSVFAKAFLDVLNDNQKIVDGDSLFDQIKHLVILNADQTPQYGDIKMTGHERGDFLFVPKGFQVAGLWGTKKQSLKSDLFRGGSQVKVSISPIEEEYRAKKNARIRQKPNVSSSQLGTLKKGASIWVAGKVLDQPWYLVEISGGNRQGYVFSSLLTPSTLVTTSNNIAESKNGDTKAKPKSVVSHSIFDLVREDPVRELPLDSGVNVSRGDTYTDSITGMQFISVKPGCFQMGSNVLGDEKPIHRVCLSAYEIGKYEVTQAQWKKVMGNNPSEFKGSNKPVENVRWDDVQQFIRKLNQQTGQHYRLPTEAEWEYACRSGGRDQKYCGSNSGGSVGWDGGNSGNKTHDVGQKQANGLGLYDMSGNVYEWVQDWYNSSYYGDSPTNNPKGPSGGPYYRVGRGGSFRLHTDYMRSAHRFKFDPDSRYGDLGFRLARTR